MSVVKFFPVFKGFSIDFFKLDSSFCLYSWYFFTITGTSILKGLYLVCIIIFDLSLLKTIYFISLKCTIICYPREVTLELSAKCCINIFTVNRPDLTLRTLFGLLCMRKYEEGSGQSSSLFFVFL